MRKIVAVASLGMAAMCMGQTQNVAKLCQQAQLSASEEYQCGKAYDAGNGVPQSDMKAARFFKDAADQGNPDAQMALGDLYQFPGLETHDPLPPDSGEAFIWHARAVVTYLDMAKGGDVHAEHELGDIYYNGWGKVRVDHEKAVFWYRKAAEQNDAGAQFALGWIYECGEGVPQDTTLAEEWYEKSARNGDTEAQDVLDSLQQADAERNAALVAQQEILDRQRAPWVFGTAGLVGLLLMVARYWQELRVIGAEMVPRAIRAKQITVLLSVASWCSGCCLYQALSRNLLRHPVNAAVTALLLSVPVFIFGVVCLWWVSQGPQD